MATVLEKSAKEGNIESVMPEGESNYIFGRGNVSLEELKIAYDQDPRKLRELRDGWLALNQMGIILPFPRNVSEYSV